MAARVKVIPCSSAASPGLDHAASETKMRQLTFTQLAQTHPDMPFSMIQKELGIPEDGVEEFIIEGEGRQARQRAPCNCPVPAVQGT